MNKRGQVYLLVALILALVLYMLMTKTNIIYENEIIDDFETLSRNYDVEASKFMNSLLSSGDISSEEVKSKFDDFTCDFTKYAKNQNPDFSLIYIFEYENKIYIGNYLKQPIIIGDEYILRGCKEGAELQYGAGGQMSGGSSLSICGECIQEIPTISELEISIGSNLYIITITSGRPEIIIVSREDKGEQRKVYTKEEFVGGREGRKAISGSEMCSREIIKTKYPRFCSGKDRIFDCTIYNDFKEACEYDRNCCWDNVLEECKPGACKT